jgi:hypothetical protein
MGLGFETIAMVQQPPFWQALATGGQFTEPLFSFYLTRFTNDPNAADIEPGGILTLGGTNSSLYQGSIEYLDMPSGVTPSYWLLDLTSLFPLISLDLDSCSHHNTRSQRHGTINQYNCCDGTIRHRYWHNTYWWSYG